MADTPRDCCAAPAILRYSALRRTRCPHSLPCEWLHRSCGRYSVVCAGDADSPPAAHLCEPYSPQVSVLSVLPCAGTLSANSCPALFVRFSGCVPVHAQFAGYFCSRCSRHAVSFRIRPPLSSPTPLWLRSARPNHNEFDPGCSLLSHHCWLAWLPFTISKTRLTIFGDDEVFLDGF